MPQVTVTTRAGDVRQVEVKAGRSLMESLRAQDIGEIEAMCGGCCSCGTCHVYIADPDLARLPPPSSAEEEVLDASSHRRANSRLSCQLRMTDDLDGLHVSVAPED